MRKQVIVWRSVEELPVSETYVLIMFDNGEVMYCWQNWRDLPNGIKDCTYMSRDSEHGGIPVFIDPVEWAYVELVYTEEGDV